MLVSRIIPRPVKDFIARRTRARGQSGTISHVYLGEKLELAVADDLTTCWYGRDWPAEERQEMLFLQGLGLKRDSLIFDIGAHQGVVALLLKRKFAPEGRVVAVEMDKLNASACRENCRLNGEPDVTSVHAAIADTVGEMRSTGRSNGSLVTSSGLADSLYEKVETTTIERMCEKYGAPDLIYLDVEGAEILALKDASSALAGATAWFIEMHGDETCLNFGGTNDSIVRLFREHGFDLYLSLAEDKPFLPLAPSDPIVKERCYLIAAKPAAA
jgi:FkbM family methyltransferase